VAGGKISLKGLKPEERAQVAKKVTDRFLKLLDVQDSEAKPLTAAPPAEPR
jgi:hypothetical protein